MEILVVKSDYDDQYYDASTPEAHRASALEILKDTMGWGIQEPNSHEEAKERLDKAQAEYDSVVQGNYNSDSIAHQAVRKTLQSAKSNYVWYADQLKDFNDATQALAEQDGKLAWAILVRRSDYESEGVSIEKVWTVKE